MAVNTVYAPTMTRVLKLSTITAPSTPPTTIQPGVPVLAAGIPAVSQTASGNGTVTQTTGLPGELTSITYKNGGAGLASGEATFALDGTHNLAVTGALTSTESGAKVYIVLADGTLTLTAGSNVLFGYTDYPTDYRKKAGYAPVRIGA